MNDEIKTAFKLLDLELDASLDLARKAYRDLVKVWHPDRFSDDSGLQAKANAKMADLNEAFEIISRFIAQGDRSDTPSSKASKTDNRQPVVILTSEAYPRMRNADYWRAFSEKQGADRLRDVFFDEPNLQDYPASGRWPLSNDFLGEVVQLCTYRYVSLESVPGLHDSNSNEIPGAVVIRNRQVLLNPASASNLTPVRMLSRIWIRDVLTMPDLAPCKERCLRALREFGFQDQGVFSSDSYFTSEKLVAERIADWTFKWLAKEQSHHGVSSWMKAVKANLRSKQFADAPREELLTFLSNALVRHAPYWTRSESEKSFTPTPRKKSDTE